MAHSKGLSCSDPQVERLLSLAAKWRAHADATEDFYYAHLMRRTAADLEKRAHELIAADGGTALDSN